MKGRHYLITGGGSGTGRAISRKLISLAAETTIWGRRQDGLEEVVSAGEATDFQVVDISDPKQVRDGFATFQNLHKPIAGVVHAAGVWTPGTLMELDPETIINHINIVTIGSVLVVSEAAKLMRDSGGEIVVIAAAAGKPGYEDTALNTLAKRALDGLQEGFARELRGTATRLTTIYPDSISSSGSDAVNNGQAMTYEDVASAILFALKANSTMYLHEIVLTAPKTGK